MRKLLRTARKDRRSIIITFAVMEFIMLMGFVWLGARVDQSVTPLTKIRVMEWNAVVQIETLSPEKILWDQHEPISVTLWLHCIQDCSDTHTTTDTVIGPAGEWVTRTTTTTLTATPTQLITHTLESLADGTSHQMTTTAPMAPFWIHWGSQIRIAREDGARNLDWEPQVAISPTVNGPGEQLLIRRVLPPQTNPDSTDQQLKGASLDIELESEAAAFLRTGLSKFIELGPIPLTILIAVGGIWMDYLRQRDELSREKLETLQKLSQERSGNIELLEAYIFHWQLVLPSSGDLIEDYDQLRKKILDPSPLLSTLSAAYERYYSSGEDLLKKVVDFYSAYKIKAQKESPPESEGALEQNLQKLSGIQAAERPPLEKLGLVLEIWDAHQVPAYSFAAHKILDIWRHLDAEADKSAFHEQINTYTRSQLYLSPVLEEIREEFSSQHWYDQVFPFQEVFTPSPLILGTAAPSRPRRGPSSSASHPPHSDLKPQKALIEQFKQANPFDDPRSLVGQRTRLQETWVPPRNWAVLVQSRGMDTEQHLICSSRESWDVHAALCRYASELSPAGINHTFMVPLDLPILGNMQDEKTPVLRTVLTALAGGWAALLSAQPVSFLNLTPPEQALLLELGIWAAGSFSAWESWLVQKEQAYQLGEGNQILRQLSKHMLALKDQIWLPSDPDRIPTQAPRWLTLRPVQLLKTYLIFTLPDLFVVVDQKPVLHPGLSALLKSSQTLAQQQIYLRGFVQDGYLGRGIAQPLTLPLRWDENNLLAVIEERFKIFREAMKPQKTIYHFGNLFKPHSPMAVYLPGKPYPEADYRLARAAQGSLGRLIFLAQALLRTLTEDDNLDYLEEKHIAVLERNNPYEPAG